MFELALRFGFTHRMETTYMKTKLLVALVGLLWMLPVAIAESTTSSIVGVVQDTSLVTVSGADLKVRNLDENTMSSTTSDTDGRFQLMNLKPGRYQVTATKPGFLNSSSTTLNLATQQNSPIEISFLLSPDPKAATVNDADMPPAVAIEIEALKNRIEQLEAELRFER